jgi:hypothetical protein
MPRRTFTRDDLAALGLPLDDPDDVRFHGDIHADELVRLLEHTQLRRCVFDAPDGRTYAIEYEAPLGAGGHVVDHGWGPAVDAVEVRLRPVAVMQWKPVPDEAPPVAGDERTVQEQLAETYIETGCRDQDVRGFAAQTLAAHTRELAVYLEMRHPLAALDLLCHARDLDAQAR